MILSSDEIEVLSYLKSWNGNFVSMVEICRCAGGRHKFKETPHWAKRLMSRLVDEGLAEVNDRGHYRARPEPVPKAAAPAGLPGLPLPAVPECVIEDYFSAEPDQPLIVGDDYFPPPEPPPQSKPAPKATKPKPERWISPHIETILKKAGKRVDKASK